MPVPCTSTTARRTSGAARPSSDARTEPVPGAAGGAGGGGRRLNLGLNLCQHSAKNEHPMAQDTECKKKTKPRKSQTAQLEAAQLETVAIGLDWRDLGRAGGGVPAPSPRRSTTRARALCTRRQGECLAVLAANDDPRSELAEHRRRLGDRVPQLCVTAGASAVHMIAETLVQRKWPVIPASLRLQRVPKTNKKRNPTSANTLPKKE